MTYLMRDTKREELEADLQRTICNFEVHNDVLTVMARALEYVQTNPSMHFIEQVADKIEMCMACDVIPYQELRNALDKYRDVILIMEKHA